jgi:hypothetical protein
MEKHEERESAPLSPNEELVGASDFLMSDESAIQGQSAAASGSRQPPLPWVGSLPRGSFGLMAVVDEDGYLVPLCTAGDLLRACKIIWQAEN